MRKFAIILSSAILSLITFSTVLFACGWSDYEDWFSSFFAPDVVSEGKNGSFHRTSMWPFYGSYKEDYVTQFNSINVQEWHSFFSGQVSNQDLSDILYTLKIEEIDTLIFYIKDTKFPASQELKKNSITRFRDKKKAREFLFYIGFARRCANYSTKSIYHWNYEEEDESFSDAEIGSLIEGGFKLLKYVKSDFIRQRYFFQITRLYFFKQDYQQCVDYYSAHQDSFSLNKSLGYRSMSYAAGANSKLGENVRANYMFAQVYQEYDELKQTAFLSFQPYDEIDLESSLELAKNTREKCAVWHLVGIKEDPLRAMENIYILDPGSDLLELLLAKAINQEEASIIPFYGDSYRLQNELLVENLLTFVSNVAKKENTSAPHIWHMAAGYLNTISGNFKLADQYLSKAESMSKGKSLALDQIKIIRIVGNMIQFKPDAKHEQNIAGDLKWLSECKHLRGEEAYFWSKRRLAEIYYASGDTIKAVCLNHYIDENYLKKNDFLDRFLAYMNKSGKTDFDKFIISVYPYRSNTLLDMQGVNLLYRNQDLKAARDKFVKAGDGYIESDPFSMKIRDCRDCDQEEYAGDYSKVKFLNEMLTLEQKISEDPDNAAGYYYLLANGYYNMTYFGNCRNLYQNDAHQPGLIGFGYSKEYMDTYSFILDCSKAKEYYEKARNASSDPEFQAKCAFMAAKCEQNEYYSSPEFNEEEIIRSGKYFNMLKTQYADTDYYQEIIEECGYFNTYLNQ